MTKTCFMCSIYYYYSIHDPRIENNSFIMVSSHNLPRKPLQDIATCFLVVTKVCNSQSVILNWKYLAQ
jgi:hypothetical protein